MELIFGALASFVIQGIKKWLGTSEWGTLGMVLLVSFSAAAIYTWLYDSVLWESLLQILIVAGAVYAYLLQRFEK
jgi:hypothetical protein